jgi:hypothetical protein
VSAPDVIIPEVVVEAHCPACCPSTTEDRGYRTTLQMPPWLAFAVRFCRMGDDGLAQHVRRVPDEYLSRGCPVDHGRECWLVRCLCGVVVHVGPDLVECSCRRWLVADDEAVYAIRLPEAEEQAV